MLMGENVTGRKYDATPSRETSFLRTPLVSSTVMSNFINLAMPKYHYGREMYHQLFFSVMLNTIHGSNTMQSILNGHAKYHQQSC